MDNKLLVPYSNSLAALAQKHFLKSYVKHQRVLLPWPSENLSYMLPKKIYLIDHDQVLVSAWSQVFEGDDRIEPIADDFFCRAADAMISPANSFGIMDGGLDLAIRAELGFPLEEKLHQQIVEKFHGELPVGCALVVATGHERWPFLVAAPTMRVPEDVSLTLNAYLAFRAALLAVSEFNQGARGRHIHSLVCPGLGTGVGKLPARNCAAQMRVAYQYLRKPARIPSIHEIHEVHSTMLRAI